MKDWSEIAETKYTGDQVLLDSLSLKDEAVWIRPKKLPLHAQREVTKLLLKQAKKYNVAIDRPKNMTDDEYEKLYQTKVAEKIRAGEIEFDPFDEDMQQTLKLCFLYGVRDHSFTAGGKKITWDEKLYEQLLSYPNVLTEIMKVVQDYNNALSLTEKKSAS